MSGVLFPCHSMHLGVHDNWGEEKFVAKDSELTFILEAHDSESWDYMCVFVQL